MGLWSLLRVSLRPRVDVFLELLTGRFQLLLSTSACVGFGVCLDLATGGELTFASYPGIQVNFFTKSIDTGVVSTIAQLYSILLSTLFSIDRQQLSFFDANYALTITSSPFAMYLVFSSICDLFGFETGLFKRVETHRHIISFFGALLLPVWVGLRLTLSLSTTAFQESEICGVPNSKAVLLDFILLFLPLTGPFTGVWCILFGLIVVSLVAIFVGWFEMLVGLLTRQEGVSGPWKRLSGLWAPLVKDVWCVSVVVCT